jgi:hypothetical protein
MDLLIPSEVINCEVQPLYSVAPFGEVQAGTVELRGLMRDLDWDGCHHLLDADDNFLCTVYPDVTLETLYVDADAGDSLPVDFFMGTSNQMEVTNANVRRVSCIPVTDYVSLVLERQRDGRYIRLGSVYFVKTLGDKGEWEAWVKGFYQDATQRTVVIR